MIDILKCDYEDIKDLRYLYDTIDKYPHPHHRISMACVRGHVTGFVKIDKKMKLRKEYKHSRYCRNCHIII